ncbi:MAG TPA: hypothetical protein PLP66_15715, partial [Phycisphaerae bacterium]|nr:hypothetical protein [Phycisphaerae bacterium]
AGLAIWHVDTQGSNNNQQQTPTLHYKVTLVQADGAWDLERYRNYGDSTDLWAAPTYTRCTPDTNPNTNWWSGESSGLYISSISESAATMYFDFLDGPDCNANGVADYQDIANCDGSAWCSDCNADGRLDECDIYEGWSVDCNENGVPDECDVAAGTSGDCNANGTPDECEILYGWYPDDNGNLVPDPCEWHAGDVNCDGLVSFGDINPFVLLMSNPDGYLDAFPDCIRLNGDVNGDGAANFADINAFVLLLSGGR